MMPYNMMDGNAYNRFVNLDSIEYRIFDFLVKSDNKYCQNLFKLLKYDTADCLMKPNLTTAEKRALLYVTNGEVADQKVMLMPYVDDALVEQGSYLRIFVDSIFPQNHVISTVNVGVQVVTHNKICNIYGEATEFNPETNPAELDENGNPTIIYKSRITEMLKSVLAALNGTVVAGVGTLQFNSTLPGGESRVKQELWNGKKFIGYKIVFSTMMSGASNGMTCAY